MIGITISKSKLHVISWALEVSSSIPAIDLDIVPLELIPIHHLLRTLGASTGVVFTPLGRLRGGNRRIGARVGNAATEGLMVHVRLAASAKNGRRSETVPRRKIDSKITYPFGTQPHYAQIESR